MLIEANAIESRGCQIGITTPAEWQFILVYKVVIINTVFCKINFIPDKLTADVQDNSTYTPRKKNNLLHVERPGNTAETRLPLYLIEAKRMRHSSPLPSTDSAREP